MISILFFHIFILHGGEFVNIEKTTGYKCGEPFELQVMYLPMDDIEGNRAVLEVEAAKSFMGMLVAAQRDGLTIKINYGFRSQEQQSYWYNKFNWMCEHKDKKYCKRAAPPGWSNHQQGLSVDISGTRITIPKEEVFKSEEYKSKMDEWVEGGGCVEVNEGFRCYTKLYYWLVENGSRFGFVNDVPNEPWHWTYQKSEIDVGG
jgi:LAS superfamily LD-carboxypeptidase LdcB